MSDKTPLHTFPQSSPYHSPWTMRERMLLLLWEYVWMVLCQWTPKPLNPWRLFCLRRFGARLYGAPFVHQRARIQIPWNLIMHDRACLGDRANAYSLGEIEIQEGATVAQEAYLCTGTHDFGCPALSLQVAKITIGKHAFIGARAFIMPGICVGEGSVIGATAVVTKDMPSWTVCAGHPCQSIKPRVMKGTLKS